MRKLPVATLFSKISNVPSIGTEDLNFTDIYKVESSGIALNVCYLDFY